MIARLTSLRSALAVILGLGLGLGLAPGLLPAAHGQFDDLPGLDEDEAGEAGGPLDSSSQVKVSVHAAAERVIRGGDLPVAIVFDIAPGWHIWANDRRLPEGVEFYEFAIKTEIEVEGEILEIHQGFMAWPEVHPFRADLGEGPVDYAFFVGRSIAYLPVTVPADAPLGPATIAFTIEYQACDDTQCLIPATEQLKLQVQIVDLGAAAGGPLNEAVFGGFPPEVFAKIHAGEKAPEVIDFDLFGIISFDLAVNSAAGFILLLLVAAGGGFLLNLTPCVLPVIPLKIMGLSQSGAGSRLRTLVLGLFMAVGVIGFWLVLGGLIAGVSSFTATNQLFQYPAFTIGIGVFIAFMAVGMCGLFSVRLPQFVYLVNPSHETMHGSVIFGIMTAILSTPCTAPFMGTAAAWAAGQSALVTLSVFAAIGAGMAAPYVVLAAFPQLVRRMPRTGPASDLIKQVMGLLMLAAAAYFIGVGLSGVLVSPPDPPSRVYWWAVGLLGVAAGGWLAWRTARITPRAGRRVVFGGIGVFFVVISATLALRQTNDGPIRWIYYTQDRFDEARTSGRVVVMEFTAEWCLNCKALEESVLKSPRVVELLNSDRVAPIKVDLTGNNTAGNEMLANVKRLTIPLLVIFKPDGEAVFKGDFYTVDQVVAAVHEAEAGRVAMSD